MFEIFTLIKKGRNFIAIEQWNEAFQDPEYIEGALLINHNGKVLLNEKIWDDINYLWPYLINGLPNIAQGEYFETNFPDQPITISVEKISPVMIGLKIFSENEVFVDAKIEKMEFLLEAIRAGEIFLTRCEEISPGTEPAFNYYIELLDKIKKNIL